MNQLSIQTIGDLEEHLSRPTAGVLQTLRDLDGDVMILGAAGKMGPTLARMVRRGLDEINQPRRRVIAVSRFSTPATAIGLNEHGIETISCDLLNRQAVAGLPLAENVLFMAGQKFGTADTPELTWAMNTIVPAIVAERFAKSRIVVFSTGCVYPLVSTNSSGSKESDPLGPPGDYANSCVGRERVFTYFAKLNQTPTLLFRLCYAIDLRYGVLCDVATKVANNQPVDVTMGCAHVIWQGDANARAIQCLGHTACPPRALNVTGIQRISIRQLAMDFGKHFNREPIITGQESETAWLWDAAESYKLFGEPTISVDEMISATAAWIKQGGTTLNKPTHFEVRDGQF